ncbi:hypothetical protein Droror1_Dr00010875 [Drosera rotundifolia]
MGGNAKSSLTSLPSPILIFYHIIRRQNPSNEQHNPTMAAAKNTPSILFHLHPLFSRQPFLFLFYFQFYHCFFSIVCLRARCISQHHSSIPFHSIRLDLFSSMCFSLSLSTNPIDFGEVFELEGLLIWPHFIAALL